MRRLSTLLATALVLGAIGCSTRSESNHGREPLSDVVLENRHTTVVSGRLRFGDVVTVAGGMMAKGDSGEHDALIGPIPEKASIDLDVYSGTTFKAPGNVTKHVHSEVEVRRQVPPAVRDGAFYFIIEEDFSLRLVVMSIADYDAMKDRHERPK